ncbi:hypothetical protein D3C75_985590 [compost metagenome]
MLPLCSRSDAQPVFAVLRGLALAYTGNLQQFLQGAWKKSAEQPQQAVAGKNVRRFPLAGGFAPAPGAELIIDGFIAMLLAEILQLELFLIAAAGQAVFIVKGAID